MILLPHVSSPVLKLPCRHKLPVVLSILWQRRDQQPKGGPRTRRVRESSRLQIQRGASFGNLGKSNSPWLVCLRCLRLVPAMKEVWGSKLVHMRWHQKGEPRDENITSPTSTECFNIKRPPAKHLHSHLTVNEDGFQEIQLTWDFAPRHFNLSIAYWVKKIKTR